MITHEMSGGANTVLLCLHSIAGAVTHFMIQTGAAASTTTLSLHCPFIRYTVCTLHNMQATLDNVLNGEYNTWIRRFLGTFPKYCTNSVKHFWHVRCVCMLRMERVWGMVIPIMGNRLLGVFWTTPVIGPNTRNKAGFVARPKSRLIAASSYPVTFRDN